MLILADDQGYADVGVFGAKGFTTPNLDQLAAQGRKFTDFHVGAAVCSSSRASLLTGCYPQRVSIYGALGPGSHVGIHPDEQLLPELLKPSGYATAIFGKWHLGDRPMFLPTRHGFDQYYGLPYSNDMWPYHPTAGSRFPKLPMYENEEVIDAEVTADDQRNLTTSYTERAVTFIEEHNNEPFFLYVPHSMPHVPLFVSDKFKGKSEQGLYGDVIMEIDWSVGRIVDALTRTGVAENTLVIFTSDNGPWLSYGNHAGSAGPLREGKGTTWEGGQREPCIMWWPGKIPAGTVCDEFCTTMDVLPTVAHLAGAEQPKKRIDGHDIRPLMFGEEGAKSPYEFFAYYWLRDLEAVRSGPWKLVFPHTYRSLTGEPGKDGHPAGYTRSRTDLALFHLDEDIGEQRNVLKEHPEVVARLQEAAARFRRKLGDGLTKTTGSENRAAGEWRR